MVAEGDDPTHSDSSGMRARAHSECVVTTSVAHFLEIAERAVGEKRHISAPVAFPRPVHLNRGYPNCHRGCESSNGVFSLEELSALAQVIFVDLVLAGDNAIVVGMAVAGLPAAVRPKIIFFGILAATVMRVLFALVTVQLFQIVGLVFAGGLLLLWVSWRLWREIEDQRKLRKSKMAMATTLNAGSGAKIKNRSIRRSYKSS